MVFDDVVHNRLNEISNTLIRKAKEYATNTDRFHNFRTAARIKMETPERALLGIWMKHLVSILDIIDWVEQYPEKITEAIINEKIGDNINYLILLEGLLKERLENNNKGESR
jgi:hypothetical protein